MINVQNISSKLASLPDQALKQYAEMHKEDPYVFSLALSESNRRKQLRSQAQQPAPQPKVVDQAIADMDVRKALPEDLGIARIPVDMNMAGGGIVAFGDGGMSHYARGGNAGEGFTNADDSDAFKFALSNTLTLEGGLNKDDPVGGLTKYGISQRSYPKLDIAKLTPADAAAIYKKDYWDKIGGDEIAKKDPKLAALAFDTAVQHGVSGAKDMLSQSGDDPAKLLQVRSEKLQSLVQNNPKVYGPQANGWANRMAKLAYTLTPGSTAQAATPTDVAAPPQETDRSITGQLKDIGSGITGLLAPQGAGGYAPGTRNFFERAADQFGVPEETQRNVSNTLNALPGASILRAPAAVGKLSAAAQAAREAEIAAAAAKAEAAAGKVANLRLPAPAPQGIASIPRSTTAPPVAPRQTFPLSPESMDMNAKVQAARQAQQLRNLEADKAAAEAASKGVTTAKNAAQTSEAMEMANAARAANMANKVITPANKAVAAARNVQAARVGSDVNMPSSTDDQQMPQGSLGPAVYETQKSPYTYQQEQYQPKTKTEEKQIVAAAKDALPKTEDTDGWSKNDWLQFGLSMMAGQSPNALTNIGAAGLAVISAKAEKAREQNKLDLYKSVHETKPGEKMQAIERLMKEEGLSFADALEKYTYLSGGSTKEDLAATKAEVAKTARFKAYQDAVTKLDGTIVGLQGKSANATPAQKQAYSNALAELEKKAMLSDEQRTTPTAPAASPIKVLSVRPNP
ncbi:Protein of unknown function DUF847 [uncultured Caudovirales phage]|uniref:TtsA-like Glycoside hydrolase family 108 domain-containing protein n=1 Tax=uncultured Caudovirales phage TaxID=2100421 RepID=A0A6J5QM13_9CAUD|nr:Protein of unknown function DUF847 [uncultured Caudovirales phage]